MLDLWVNEHDVSTLGRAQCSTSFCHYFVEITGCCNTLKSVFHTSSSSSCERVVTIHSLAALPSGQVLSSQSIVSSSRTVRPCSPWRSMEWTLEDDMVNVYSSEPHSQGAEEAIPHLCKQERKRPTPRRRLSRTQEGSFQKDMLVSEMKVRSLVELSNHSAFHQWSAQSAARMLLLSHELMSCCEGGTNVCLDLRCRAFQLDGPSEKERPHNAGNIIAHLGRVVYLHPKRSLSGLVEYLHHRMVLADKFNELYRMTWDFSDFFRYSFSISEI